MTGAVLLNPSGDQTISADNLLPAAGNTTQSLGSSAATWEAVLGTVSTSDLNGIQVVDGINHATIQSAINACPSTGGTVYLPAGTYTQNTALTLKNGIRIIGAGCGSLGAGAGQGVTQINTTLTSGALFPITGLEGVHISDIAINNTGSGGGTAFLLNYGQYCLIERFVVYGAFSNGIVLNPAGGTASTIFNDFRDGLISLSRASSVCILIDSGTSTDMVNNSNQFSNLNLSAGSSGTAVSIVGGSGGNPFCNENVFRGVQFFAASGTGIDVQWGRDNLFLSCTIETNTTGVTLGSGSFGSTLLACEISGNTTQVSDSGSRTFITGNIGGTQQVYGVSQTGSLKANSYTLTAAGDNGANTFNGPTGWAIMGSGTTVALINTASFEAVQNLVCDKKISSYNGVSTIGNGVPSEIELVALTAQAAIITNHALFTPGTSGLYRVSFNAKVTRAASGGTPSSTLGGSTGFTVKYKDATDSTASVVTPSTNVTPFVNSGNALTAAACGSVVINAASGTAVTFSYGYTSSGTTAMQFEVQVVVESL